MISYFGGVIFGVASVAAFNAWRGRPAAEIKVTAVVSFVVAMAIGLALYAKGLI